MSTHSADTNDGRVSLEKRASVKEKEEDSTATPSAPGSIKTSESDYPDGGLRAWLIVVGAMCSTFASFGYVNTWGIFQNYYETTLLKSTPSSSIAWIGSIQYSLALLPALFVGRLFDVGYFRSIFIPSGCIVIIATFLTAECKEYWHFLLCQGFLVGIGCGGVFGNTPPAIAHWFKKRRGIAMGFVSMGSSVGGTVLPILGKNLLPAVGFQWTMRIFGFILLAMLIASNLLLDRRLAPRKMAGGLFNFQAFKSAPFTVYCASGFFTFLGLYTVLTYVDVSATSKGISPDFAFYYVAIVNASSLFGRYTSGNLCDPLGAMNVIIPFTAAAGVLTYAWPFAQSKASLIVVVIIYGFSSGAYLALFSNPVLEMGDTLDVGRRSGMFRTITALGALAGPPISGAINTKTGEYKAVGYYAGTMVLIGVGLMSVARHLLLKRLLGKI